MPSEDVRSVLAKDYSCMRELFISESQELDLVMAEISLIELRVNRVASAKDGRTVAAICEPRDDGHGMARSRASTVNRGGFP